MRPLLVLLLVIAAVGAFFLAMNIGGDGGPTAGLESPAVGATPAEDPAASSPDDLAAPERRVAEGSSALAAPERIVATSEHAIRGNSLSGRVETTDGTPVAGATVTLTKFGQFSALFGDPAEEGQAQDRTTKTTAKGEFVFKDVETYTEFSLIATHPEHGRKEEGNIQLSEGEVKTDILVTLSGGVRLFGNITDVGGNAVPGAKLYLGMSALGAFADEAGPNTLTRTSDEQGGYEFRNVANGNYSLTVVCDGYGRVTLPQLNVTGNEDLEKNVVLEIAFMIGGNVVASDGRPVADATIQAFSMTNRQESTRSQVLSNEAGDFLLDDVRSGTYTLLVKADGYRPERKQRVETGDMAVSVELTPLPVVKGRVVDSLNNPVTAFEVQLRTPIQNADTTMPLSDTRRKVRDAADGSFTLPCPNHGEFVVEARADGYAPCFSERFNIVYGQELTGVVVQMTQGGTIRGRIVDARGEPVPNARIKTHDTEYVDDPFWRSVGEFPSQATVAETRSGETGDFEVAGLSPATYQIDVRHAEYAQLVLRDVVVQEAQVEDVGDVRVSQGASIGGTVVGPAGKGLPGALVQLQLEASATEYGAMYSTRTDAQGGYEFRHVPPGSYDIYAQRQGGSSPFEGSLDVKKTKRKIAVTEGQSYTQDFNIVN